MSDREILQACRSQHGRTEVCLKFIIVKFKSYLNDNVIFIELNIPTILIASFMWITCIELKTDR